jgi:hypothetical protein
MDKEEIIKYVVEVNMNVEEMILRQDRNLIEGADQPSAEPW